MINEERISSPTKDTRSHEEFKNAMMLLKPKECNDSEEDIEKEDEDKHSKPEEPVDKHFFADFADVDFNKNTPIKNKSPDSKQINNTIAAETYEKYGLTNL
jgi:hypothetical protein